MFLQVNTAGYILLGPFLDDADGKTPETGLSLSATDILISKAGGELAAITTEEPIIHSAQGYYIVSMEIGDRDTIGILEIVSHPAGCRAVRQTYFVQASGPHASLAEGYVDGISNINYNDLVAFIWDRPTNYMTLTGSIGKLIASYLDTTISSRAQSATALSTATWSATKAGYLNSSISAIKTVVDAINNGMPTVEEIDAQLSGSHGAETWGAGAVGTIAYPDPLDPFLDSNGDPQVGVKIEAHSNSDKTALVDVQITDINGNFQFHLDAGEYWFRASLQQHVSFEWFIELGGVE